jgi:hypothetical protein
MEFYSATKKNEILSSAITWMELENIILSEVSWLITEGQKPYMWIIGLIQTQQYYEKQVILREGHI